MPNRGEDGFVDALRESSRNEPREGERNAISLENLSAPSAARAAFCRSKTSEAVLKRPTSKREDNMRAKLLGAVTAAALLGSIGVASAQEPIQLTDTQLDAVTSGANPPIAFLSI